jgi:menaquinone-dependent protoporphyrinogen IX oxidase
LRSCLVVCATSRESTCRVGAEIANALRLDGIAVDLECGRDIEAFDDYDAIVLGAPLCHGRWGRETMRFLRRHRQSLQEKDVSVFALRPCNPDSRAYDRAWDRIIRVLTRIGWLHPVRIEVFPDVDAELSCCDQTEISRWCRSLEVSMHLTEDVPDQHGTG